jgi:cytosine/adenosine deaminase-related metal-dependent hydrolase
MSPHMSMKDRPITVLHAGALRDAAGVSLRPGSIAVGHAMPGAAYAQVLRVGRARDMPANPDRVIELPDRLLMPTHVNAHAHLDLTLIGSQPFDGDFPAWLRMVAAGRPIDDDGNARAVRRGVELSREAGVGCVGDIAYFPAAIRARQRTGLAGVSYLEVFGLGSRQAERIEQTQARLQTLRFAAPAGGGLERVVVGLSPHAPYSAADEVYRWATKMSEEHAYRLCTHAAESREELQFLRDGSGPLADHLRSYGCSDADIAAVARGLHPIDHLEPALRRGRLLLVHCNYIEDAHIHRIRKHGASVAYCPVASECFGHQGHRYRDMLAAGVNVCLGTDSIVCQPPADAQPQPLGILPQMRRLYRRDGTDPDVLLAMATVNGMRALQWLERDATLGEHAPATFCTAAFDPGDPTDPLEQVLRNDVPAEWVEVAVSP